MEQITSTKNSRVKEWGSLKQKKFRDQKGLYLIEGTRLVGDALRAAAPVQTLLVSREKMDSGKLDEVINRAYSLGVELIEVTDAVIEHVTDTKTPQGVVAIVEKYKHHINDYIKGKKDGLYVALDQIQDPGNLGTMIRTADAVGATGVFVGSGSVDLYNPKVVRATMGSLFHLPIFERDLPSVLSLLKKEGIQIIGTNAHTGQSVYDSDLTGGIALLIGSEAHGLSPGLQDILDREVVLPMPGQAESLNAAVAAGVILYEALRQRII